MRDPLLRAAATEARTWSMDWRTVGVTSRRARPGDLLAGLWIARGPDIVDVGAPGCDDRLAQPGVLLHERRNRSLEQAEDVVAHENLAVAIGAGADADRRDRHV